MREHARDTRVTRVTCYDALTSAWNFEATSSFGSVNKSLETVPAIYVSFSRLCPARRRHVRTRSPPASRPSAFPLPRGNIATPPDGLPCPARSALAELVSLAVIKRRDENQKVGRGIFEDPLRENSGRPRNGIPRSRNGNGKFPRLAESILLRVHSRRERVFRGFQRVPLGKKET